MTEEALAELWTARRERIDRILEEPHRYKECEHCRSISFQHTGRCPICQSYRFTDDPRAVAATAREMLRHPFPLTAAVPPRLLQNSSYSLTPLRPRAKRIDLYEKEKRPL
jgi:uncharacterized Zn finger protein (UPF0148 family)